MTVPEIEVIRAFNILFRAEKLPGPLYSRIMRFGAAAYMNDRTPDPAEPKLELPAWSVEPIQNLAREMMASIRATGVRIVGDLDGLTAVPRGRAEPMAVTVSPEVAATAAMGVLVASGLARGTAPISTSEAEEDALDPDEKPRRAPRIVQEPAELQRITTSQLGIVIVRRARAALFDRLSPLKFWRRRR